MTEVWKDIPGYEGYYQASNLGNIRSLDRYIDYKKGKRFLKGKNLKPGKIGKYIYVILCINYSHKQFSVHRLVLMSFVRMPNPNEQCRHLDGNSKNNNLNNLCWGTRSENAQDAVRHGTHYTHGKNLFGENNGRAKLSENDVKWIRENKNLFLRADIAKKYNITWTTVNNILNYKLWKHT